MYDAFPEHPDWLRMNCVVKPWIIGTVSADIADAAVSCDASARDA
jgi:hypothetical protein